MSDATSIMCPEQKTKIGYNSLSRRTVVKHVEKISDSFTHQLRDASKQILFVVLSCIGLGRKYRCTGHSTIVGVYTGKNTRFQLIEYVLSVGPLKYTFNAVENTVERIALKWNKIASVTTDGVRALTGKKRRSCEVDTN